MKIIFLFALISCSQILWALPAGTKGEDGNFKVSEKSLVHLGVRFSQLSGDGPWSVPKAALVTIKLTQGVYRRLEGEITYVIVKIADRKDDQVIIKSQDLEARDEIAITGVKYLRMAETDLNSETVDNCAH